MRDCVILRNLNLVNSWKKVYNVFVSCYIVTGELAGKPAERKLICFDP